MTDEVFPNGTTRKGRNSRIDVAPQRDDPMRFDQDLLTADEKEALRAKARATIVQEQKDKLRDALYAQFLDEERRTHDPKKATVPILLQLAAHAQYIMLDGRQYHTDQVYHVTSDVAAVLIEQMNRGWAHEELTEVRDYRTRRRGRPPPGIGYGNFMDNRLPRNMQVSTGELVGAVAKMQTMMHG